MKTLIGGVTDYDTAIDDDIPFFISPDTDVDDELAMKVYKNIDPWSPHHLACHLAKCAVCTGVIWANTLKVSPVDARDKRSLLQHQMQPNDLLGL